MIGLYKTAIGIILLFTGIITEAKPRTSFRAGMSMSIGTHCRRAGLFAMAHGSDGRFQSGIRADWFTVAKAWGHGRRGWESQLSAMAGAGYGCVQARSTMYLDLTSPIVPYRCFVGYSYIVYTDSYRSSQRSGILQMNWGRMKFSTENDFFGQKHCDRFRTAGALIAYQTDTAELGIKLVLWTGDAFDRCAVKRTDTDYPARFGYKDISRTRYGRYSIGALGVQARSDSYWGQSLCVYAGADAEQFRNIFQNKFIHDLWFVPRGWLGYKMMNYPMLDRHGDPYLFLPDEEPVRKPKPIFQVGANEPQFY